MTTSRRGFLGISALGVAAATTLTPADLGLAGDGVTNDHPAMQAALDAAVKAGRPFYLPAGDYRLDDTVKAQGAVAFRGDGANQTVLKAPDDAPALAFGSLAQSGPHGLDVSGFTITSTSSTDAPLLDVLQYGRKWTIDRVHLDAGYGDRPGIRLWTSWCGTISNCNFWKFADNGVATDRAAILVKPQLLAATGNGPINSLAINDCSFERVQTAIDLHDRQETGTTTQIHAVSIRNPRFKNTAVDGYATNSVGVRASNPATYGVVVENPFFEDFSVGMSVQGYNWTVISPFAQSGNMIFDLYRGGGHRISGLTLYGSSGNGINTGVRCRSGVTRKCWLDGYFSPTGGTYLGNAYLDESGGELVVTQQ